MRTIMALLLTISLLLTGCAQSAEVTTFPSESGNTESATETMTNNEATNSTDLQNPTSSMANSPAPAVTAQSIPDFNGLDDPRLLRYVEDNLYVEMVNRINSDSYFVENVSAVYVSNEYLEELSYNSRSNIFFGYTLEELEDEFQGTKYIFTLGDDGTTSVEAFEGYDDTYERVIKNVAIGTGVILICVTVSAVTGGAGAPAASMIFAASAKTGTVFALSSGALSGVATGVVAGIQGANFDEAIEAGALAGSESFKWGALLGAVSGGASEAIALKGATMNGLTMNEAAAIQKESKYPVEVIKQFHTTEEYEALKAANLKPYMIDGKTALIRSDINLDLVDELGRTNLQRMKLGLSPLDANGATYELHHIGQEADATLAILTQAEHDNAALHGFKVISEIDRNAFAAQRKAFWKTMATLLEGGAL